MLAALFAAPAAFAQDAGPCRAAETFNARRCADRVADALMTVETSAPLLGELRGCAATKKKKDLQTCAAGLEEAAQQLIVAAEILAAASEAASPAPAGEEDGMVRPGAERANPDGE
jgi:hypothetical protein